MTDTSKEAVERLARHVADLTHQAAATLRALLAERDKATRERALREAAHVAQSFGPMDRDEILAIIDKYT